MKRALLGVLLCFAVEVQAAELVTNGGFEAGNFSGWTQFGNTGFTDVDLFFGHSGSFGASFGPVSTTGGIFQTLSTTAGQTYHIEFWLSNIAHFLDGTTPNSFEFNWDGGAAEVSLSDAAAFSFTLHSFDLVASSASTDLRFTFRHDPMLWRLDDVSVVAAAASVPEPATLVLLGAGLAGLGFAFGRKRSSARRH